MKDTDILESVETAKNAFNPKCKKYSGAVTVEIIRQALDESGICVSHRDVFIRGLPIEFDILIPKMDATPLNRVLYEPSDVLAVIEVKNMGSFGDETIQTVEGNATRLRSLNPKIKYCYLTLSEREGFRWAISDKNVSCTTYTLFWHKGSGIKKIEKSTGDWDRFINDMQSIQQRA